MKIGILAAGTWGTALAKVLALNNDVTVWSKFPKEIEELSTNRVHKNLPGAMLPESIKFTIDLKCAVAEADIIIIATPSVYVRETMVNIRDIVTPRQIMVCVSKGIEAETLLTMSGIIEDVLEGSNPVVALSGPTHAEEVALDIPTLIVSASQSADAAATVQRAFVGTCVRPYTNEDIIGVELCGALKNIIALGCGIALGLGYGDNTRAALITRGMSEIRNLGCAMGCTPETFAGLAGMGDLIVTATSRHSRNNRAGQLIGGGMSLEAAIKDVGMVVEGVNALPAAVKLAAKYSTELPIINAVNGVVTGEMTAAEAVTGLLNRNLRSEFTLHYERELFNQ